MQRQANEEGQEESGPQEKSEEGLLIGGINGGINLITPPLFGCIASFQEPVQLPPPPQNSSPVLIEELLKGEV